MSPRELLRQAQAGGIWALVALIGWWLYTPAESDRAPAPSEVQTMDESEPLRPLPALATLGLNDARVTLGRRLFHDPRLSVDDSVSCASCHDLGKGGVDNLPVSLGVGGQRGVINSPTVYNCGFNFVQFWDGRAVTLEDQAEGPVMSRTEMATDWPSVVAKLGQDAELVATFKHLYGDGLTALNIRQAIAEFERSLVTPARFDRYLRGENTLLSEPEVRGYRLFRDYGCVACHQGVNIGGNMFQRLGVVRDYFKDRRTDHADQGRYNVTRRPEDMHVFKVPSLRNVALTAPYFHNASAQTLDEAVTVMARYQLGVELPNEDRAALVAFLKSLTGDGLEVRP